jgi:hypothetical protein
MVLFNTLSAFSGFFLTFTVLVTIIGDRFAFRKTTLWMGLIILTGVSSP